MAAQLLRPQNACSLYPRLCALLLMLAFVGAPVALAQSELLSDDFHTPSLNTEVWTIVDPLGDSTVILTGTQLLISVPAGTNHDVWADGNLVPQVLQTIDDVNFEAVAKFESTVSAEYQQQGFLIQADEDNLVRLEVHSTRSDTRVFAATVLDRVPTTRIIKTVTIGTPHYLRVQRVDDQWTLSYSDNGADWTVAGSFTYVLPVTTFGLFAGNAGGTAAHTAVIDYLFNPTSPISPEDGNASEGPHTLTVNVAGNGSVIRTPNTAQYATGTNVTLTAVPSAGSQFQAWSGAVWSRALSVSVPVTEALEVTATFSVIPSPALAVISDVNVQDSEPTISGLTNEKAIGPEINVWYGSQQVFGHLGHPQQWVNLLGHVSDPDGVATLSYSLNDGPQQLLSIGPDGRRLAMPGDFNVEIDRIDLNDGLNSVAIIATNNTGSTRVERVDIEFSSSNTWSTTYSINWDGVRQIQDRVEVVDGLWTLVPGGIRTTQVGYDRLLAIGDMAWDYYEITIPVTIHAVLATADYHGYGVGIQFGWSGHTNSPVTCEQLHCGWLSSGPTAWWSGDKIQLGSKVSTGPSLQLGIRYNWKFRVQPSRGKALYSVKVWEDGTREPEVWHLGSSKPILHNGSLLLVGHNADVTFGDVIIRPTESQ